MAEAQYDISLEADSNVVGIGFRVTVRDEAWEPLQGADVHLRIEGNGTFATGGLVETDVTAFTDDAGSVMVNWWEYPLYRPRREIRSVLTARCDFAACEVILSRLTSVEAQS